MSRPHLHPSRPTASALAVVFFYFLALAPVSASAQLTSSATPSATTVHVHVSRPANPQVIPSTVFGSFLEPIDTAVYGGLWADVVENGSFEEGLWSLPNLDTMEHDRPELRHASELGLPTPWEPLRAADGSRYLPVRGDAANATQSVLIMGLPGKEIGVRQLVYLSPQRELHYTGALWLKHVRGGETVRIALRRHAHPEDILASQSVDVPAVAWTKFPFALTLKPGQLAPLEPADLTISLDGDARVMVDQVSLQPADNIAGMDPDMIHLLQSLHSPLLRFGGNFTSAYDWRDGIGPADKRIPKLNFSWGIPEYNTFGTDEFLKLCELIRAQPQIALNLGTGTPEAAGEWVRYVNQHFGDHTGGLLWELGNELWGDYQIGYPSEERATAVTIATSRAVRAVDPHARLIATGADQDHFLDWNAALLSAPVGTFDFLSTHFVVNPNVQLRDAPDDFRTMAALALPVGLSKQLRAIHDQIETTPHKGLVKTAFTEWLIIGNKAAPNYSNMGGALFAASFLNTILRDVAIAPISDMTGNVGFGGLWKKRGQVYPSPAFWALRAYATAAPHTLLSVRSDGPTYTISHGIEHLPNIANVPYLDITAAASEDGKRLLLFCVNRSLTTAANAEFDLASFHVGSGPMRASTLEAETILSENNEEHPDLIKPTTSMESIPSGRLVHTFPNASVTVLEIPLAPE